MSQLLKRVSVLSVLCVITASPLHAQNLLQQLQIPGYSVPAPMSPYQKTAKWDYRFDPQYQSTIKPYLRWYMRYDPSQPGNRVLPRDFGFGMKYGYAFMNPAAMNSGHSNFFSTCGGSCGYGWGMNDFANSSDPNNRPSLYWNHLRYLSDVYGTTPIRRRDGELRNESLRDSYRDLYSPDMTGDEEDAPEPPADDLLDSAYRGRVVAERTIWVAPNGNTRRYSILYHEPPKSVADQFTEARALIGTGAKIVQLSWIGEPPAGDNLELVAGRLSSRF